MFGTILISVITVMHIYVIWRTATVPIVKQRIPLKYIIGAGVLLWGLFVMGRVYGHHGVGTAAAVSEFIGMNWMAALFLMFICMLTVDLVTAFGVVMKRLAPSLRGTALIAGALLSVIALVQGLRPPVIEKHEVILPGLPPDLDGTTIAAMSDLHLGSLIGEKWAAKLAAQVQTFNPDIAVLLGDIFEGHGRPDQNIMDALKRINPPLGLWFVQGNHEHHGDGNMAVIEKNFNVLKNRWVEVKPGLTLAGIEDLTRARRSGRDSDAITRTLADHPPGAVVLLSHTPWHIDRAVKAGAGLMLCGHTHGGQIWPFGYLVRQHYPFFDGRYEINGMTLIVSRGAGTWGPRMRLWKPGEILHITLRASGAA